MSERSRSYTFAATLVGMLAVLYSLAAALSGFSSVAHADPKGVKFTGVGSCGGKGCHSEEQKIPKPPNDIAHDESTIWARLDYHARAFSDQITKNPRAVKGLSNPKSLAIVKKLGIPNATTSERCTSCHALSGFSNGESKSRIKLDFTKDVNPEDLAKERFKPTDGVSCDGCHGPSQNYLTPHQAKGWTQQQRVTIGGDKLYDQVGLYDTKNLRMRANMCVSCHLKIEADLIQAGHPELPFELDSFCHGSWMHWRPQGDYFGVKAWAMGQFVCMREAALQLNERVKGKVSPGLILDSYKQLAAHVIMSRHPAKLVAPDLDAGIGKQIAAIHDGWSDPAKVMAACEMISKSSDALAEKLLPMKFDAAQSDMLLNDVSAEGEAAGMKGFRPAQQYTYAMTSLIEARFLKGAAPDPDRAVMDKKMKGQADFEKLTAVNDEIDDPAKYNADSFVKAAKDLMSLFKGGKMIALPPNPPDAGGAMAMTDKKPDTPPVVDKKPDTPPVIDKKPDTPPVVDKKPDTPPVVDKKPDTPPVVDKKPDTQVVVKPDPQKKPDETSTVKISEPADNQAPLSPKEFGTVIFCPNCRLKCPIDYKYCPRCGHALPQIEK